MADNLTKSFSKDEVIFREGDDITGIYIIKGGTVMIYGAYEQYKLGKEDVLGISDAYNGKALFTAIAEEECTLEVIEYNSAIGLSSFVRNLDNPANILRSYISFVFGIIKSYLSLNIKCKKKDSEVTPDSRVNKWELDYYNTLFSMAIEDFERYFNISNTLIIAELARACCFMLSLNKANIAMADKLGINKRYTEPVIEPPKVEKPAISMLGNTDFSDDDIFAILTSSFHKILAYCNYTPDEITDYRNRMNAFVNCKSKLATDDTTRAIRKSISEIFYDIYYRAFIQSTADSNMPVYIKMFLHFGYLDERLVGKTNAAILFRMSDTIEGLCNNSHIFTMYGWLKTIFWDVNIPSKNQFDQNFDEYIREQQKADKLPDAIEKDPSFKLRYEIENMFRSVHRMTYGKTSSFTPILIEENIMKPLDTIIVTAETIMRVVNAARKIDFSLFYRSTLYSNEKININKEYIFTEYLPNFILTPCLGTYGAMWQEIEGRNRGSSGRFMLPIMCNANIENIIYNILGKFRWEMCKRIQGMYWNNLSEKSLTSEYYDYIQFYKKNKELNDETKEKIKSTLINCHNNYAEVFAKDYERWLVYESQGINKLNKVARVILAKYCPFNKNIRSELAANPAFTKCIEIYERNCGIQKHHLNLVIQSLTAKGFEIPEEIRETRAYLDS